MAVKYALGVDIGGTKVAVGLVNDTGHVAYSLKVPSNKESSETLFQCVCTAIRELLNSQQLNIEDVSGIGVGLPGKVDVENGIAVFKIIFHGRIFLLLSDFKKNLEIFQ